MPAVVTRPYPIAASDSPVTTPRLALVAALGAGLLLARLLGAHFVSFFQNDEVSLAAGVAALVQGGPGDIYRYGPQAGYYRLVQLLDGLLGGDMRRIPQIMIVLSAVAGAAIPVTALYAFPTLLRRSEQWLLFGFLAANPILWMSASYGNSTMPSTAIAFVAIAMLSRQPGRLGEAVALALYGLAVFLRADTVLAWPAVAVLLYQRYGYVRAAFVRLAAVGGALAAVYAVMFLADARMAGSVGDVAGHLTNREFETRFFDYLLWSTSPIPLLMAAVGARELLVSRRALLAVVAAWCLPFFVFYFAATTSPRYFVPSAVPVAILSAVGFLALADVFDPSRRRKALAALGILASLHLFIGLGYFTPGSPKNMLKQAQFETQVGPLWTGALLYKSYLQPDLLRRSLRHDGFDRTNRVQRALDSTLSSVATGAERGRSIAVVLNGWNGHVFHYYARVHGARYDSIVPGPVFLTEHWLSLGGARLMVVARNLPQYQDRPSLPLAGGDQAWLLSPANDDGIGLNAKAPAGHTFTPLDTLMPLRRYRLERTAP